MSPHAVPRANVTSTAIQQNPSRRRVSRLWIDRVGDGLGRHGGHAVPFRPRVSSDNPYSESLFKTMKYGPMFPERFASLGNAGTFISGFVDWYNHHHSGIGFHTLANVYHGVPTVSLRSAHKPWLWPGPSIPTGSPPRPTPRSWPCPGPHGSTIHKKPPEKQQPSGCPTHRGTA